MAEKNLIPNKTLDCTGFACPIPVLKTRREINKLAVGEVLKVLADDPAAEEDIPNLIKSIGQELLGVRREGSKTLFLIKKIK
ncbi:MAG: sulfurtransferase TusA family protein [Candidatus Bathyarchaeia archaeon]